MENSMFPELSEKDNILYILPNEYEYIFVGDCTFKNDHEFQCKINVKNIHEEDDAKRWIAKLSECTLTTWRVRRTYPASSRCNVYKVAMKCQHNVNHKFKSDSERKKNHISKHTGCPSNLIITIKRYVKNSKAQRFKSSDPALIKWPCFVDLKFVHNHPLKISAVLRFRPMCNKVRENILKLFEKGHTAASALECIKLELFLNNDDKYFEVAEDRFYVPTLSQVQYLFYQTFKIKDSSAKPTVEQIVENYNNSVYDGKVETGRIDEYVFISICSPIMTRAHKLLPHASQIVIVDSKEKIDKKNCYVFFFVSPTPAGSVPLGCIISDADGPDIMNSALEALRRCFPPGSFYNQNYPSLVLSKDDTMTQNCFKMHWPNCVQLSCQSYFMKSAWNWLNCTNNVPKHLREEIYCSIKSLVYCQDEKDLIELYSFLLAKYHLSLTKFVSYLNTIWPNRLMWSSAYRCNIPTNFNSDYIEMTYKVMKDCLLERFRHYNLIQLIDFITVYYEKYIEKRLIDFTQGKVYKRLLYKYVPPTDVINPSTIIQSEIDFSYYLVPSESDYSVKYMVDVKHGLCSCENGKLGRVCIHLIGVVNQIQISENITEVPQAFNNMLYKIATGNEPKQVVIEETLIDPIRSPSPKHTDTFAKLSIDHPPNLKLSENEQFQLTNFFNSIHDGLENKSNSFVPAIRAMLNRYSEMKSEDEFANALQMFGHSNSSVIQKCNKVKTKKRKENIIQEKNNPLSSKSRKFTVSSKKFISILPRLSCETVEQDPLS